MSKCDFSFISKMKHEILYYRQDTIIVIVLYIASILLLPIDGFILQNPVKIKNDSSQSFRLDNNIGTSSRVVVMGVVSDTYCFQRKYKQKVQQQHLNAVNSDDDDDNDNKLITFFNNSQKPTKQEVAEIVDELEATKPSTMAIMTDLLGINVFTYILAGLIILFLSLNSFLGPGWLGNVVGLSGTGAINSVSHSLPKTIDLSNSDYLL